MEHRVTQETTPAEPGKPRRRLSRRIARVRVTAARGRLGLAILVGVILLGILVYAAARLAKTSIAWLHEQPHHRLRFREIELSPAPPAYIRSGRIGLLDHVRDRGRLPAELKVLDLDLPGLARSFALHSPWVEQVDRVERAYPNRLVVRLVYRKPVAYLLLGASGRILIDHDAVVLPSDDTDVRAAGRLIRIEGLPGPFDARPGLALGTQRSAGGQAPHDVAARAAARLAAFLLSRMFESNTSSPRLTINVINPHYGERLLEIRTEEGLWVLWGESPGHESGGSLTANQKWEQLREWIERHDPPAPGDLDGSYLELSPRGARLRAVEARPGS